MNIPNKTLGIILNIDTIKWSTERNKGFTRSISTGECSGIIVTRTKWVNSPEIKSTIYAWIIDGVEYYWNELQFFGLCLYSFYMNGERKWGRIGSSPAA